MYTAVAAVGTFLTPSYELSMANRLVRLFLLVLVALVGLPGFVLGTLITLAFLVATRSFGVPYMWPLIPFNWTAIKKVFVRSPVPVSNLRPSILKPQDKYRQGLPEPARRRRD